MKIADHEIFNNNPYIISEISANHSKKLDIARALIKECADAGANAVKFQTFSPEEIAADGIRIRRGIDKNHDNWLNSLGTKNTLRDLLSGGGLPCEWHEDLKYFANWCGIDFISTPFSVYATKFLVDLGVPAIKIASGDLTFTPLLEYVNSVGLPAILSTGGAYLHEVVDAVDKLKDLRLDGKLAILHCRSIYPCDPEDTNLLSIKTLARQFPDVVIGYSDHTTNIDWVPVQAVTLGARIIEKHVGYPGIFTADSQHSISPQQLGKMIRNIKSSIKALGEDRKMPHPKEMHDRLWARRDPHDWLRPTKEAREGKWE